MFKASAVRLQTSGCDGAVAGRATLISSGHSVKDISSEPHVTRLQGYKELEAGLSSLRAPHPKGLVGLEKQLVRWNKKHCPDTPQAAEAQEAVDEPQELICIQASLFCSRTQGLWLE